MKNNGIPKNILTIYFSGTGNTKYIAERFSHEMEAKCLSIEDEANFTDEIKNHDVITFCYPIYGSRIPRNIRKFVMKHMNDINGKKIIIFVTQALFSGDGARVFTDMFWDGSVEVIYAEHFLMPNNINNFPIFRKASEKTIRRYVSRADVKIQNVCRDIKNGIIKKRGFSRFSQFFGNLQGIFWQGNSKELEPSKKSMEERLKTRVKINDNCTSCNLCVNICPVKNFKNEQNKIIPKGNCVACYRCINRCPEKAVLVWNKIIPKWQYPDVTEMFFVDI